MKILKANRVKYRYYYFLVHKKEVPFLIRTLKFLELCIFQKKILKSLKVNDYFIIMIKSVRIDSLTLRCFLIKFTEFYLYRIRHSYNI